MVHPYLRRGLWIIMLILIFVILYYFISIVIYILISAVLTLIGRPIFNILTKKRGSKFKIPSSIAALLTLLLFYLVGAAVIGLFVPLIIDEIQLLSEIKPELVVEKLKGPLTNLTKELSRRNIDFDLFIAAKKIAMEFAEHVFSSKLLSNFSVLLSSVGDVAALLFSVSFITFFFVKEEHLIIKIIDALTPDEYEESVHRVINNSKYLLRRYFVGLLIQVTLLAILYFLGFRFIINAGNAFLIAFFCGLLNMIPFIGPVIAFGFSFLIILSTSLNGDLNIGTILLQLTIVFGIVRSMDDFLLQPIIFSNSVKAHPLEIFLIILMGARLAGIPGMVIAIPVYTVLRVIAGEFFSHIKFIRELTSHLVGKEIKKQNE